MAIKDTFAKRLTALRKERNISQTDLAQALGISRGSLSFYEHAERTADIEILCRTSEYFGVTVDYLLGNSENKTRKTANIGATTGLSDAAIEMLQMAAEEKALYKTYNDCCKYYYSDLLSLIIENINYFPDLADHFLKILNTNFGDCNDLEIEDEIIEKAPKEIYHKIYSNGTVIIGSSYQLYLKQIVNEELARFAQHIMLKINPVDPEHEKFFVELQENCVWSMKKRLKNIIEHWRNRTDIPKEENLDAEKNQP